MKVSLYLITTNIFPEQICGGEELLLIKGENEDIGDPNIDELGFASTLGIHSDTPWQVLTKFKDWWNENVKIPIQIEHLTSETELLQDYRLTEISSLDENEWTMKSNFIAYPKNSSVSYERVIEFIEESELRLK